jgi:hypothetical protein
MSINHLNAAKRRIVNTTGSLAHGGIYYALVDVFLVANSARHQWRQIFPGSPGINKAAGHLGALY